MPPPVGFKRSRALWDNATHRSHDSWVAAVLAHVRAILYELQPVRLSTLGSFSDWKRRLSQVYTTSTTLVVTHVPVLARHGYTFVSSFSRTQWLWVGVVVLYYYLVKWIHEALEVGPFVLMTTALVLIFTVGLGDDTNKDGLSAYAVFNRGFQRLLGSVNEQELLRQHVGGGGGLMMMGGGMGAPPPDQRNQRDDDDDDDFVPRGRAAQGRNHPPPPEHNPPPENLNDDDAQAPPARPPPRRSGKKARRRNLEQRREMRRQQEAAAAMGFVGGGDHPQGGGAQEAMATQQLLEQHMELNNAPMDQDDHESEEEDDDDDQEQGEEEENRN